VDHTRTFDSGVRARSAPRRTPAEGITLSWSFTGLLLLILRTRIKRIGSSNSGKGSNRGFSYIFSSWLIEEGQKPKS